MTNLALPKMDYHSLRQLANEKAPDGRWLKIAYATWIRRSGADIEIKHHKSVIATVSLTETVIDPCGYHTPTTADRLDTIVYANVGMHVNLSRKEQQIYVRYPDSAVLRPITGVTTLYNKEQSRV